MYAERDAGSAPFRPALRPWPEIFARPFSAYPQL